MSDNHLQFIKFIAVLTVAILVVTFGPYFWFVAGGVSDRSGDWGTFGDFIGGFAGTLIAVLTLVVLLQNFRLQAKELSETSKTLDKQVKATNSQIALIDAHENRRVQPVLKVEWFPLVEGERHVDRKYKAELRFTNIGFGPCLIERIYLQVDSNAVGNYDAVSGDDAQEIWERALADALQLLYPGQLNIVLYSMNKYRAYLAANETQRMLTLAFDNNGDMITALIMLEHRLQIDINFRSMSKVRMSTHDQEGLFDLRKSGTDPESGQNR